MLTVTKNPIVRLAIVAAAVALAVIAVAAPALAESVRNGYVKSVALSSAPANGMYYAAGDVISVDAAFSKDVRVARRNSNAAQRMLIMVNGNDRLADYAGRVGGDDSVHRFSYTATAADGAASLTLYNIYYFIMWLLNPFASLAGLSIADAQVDAVEIQTVDSVFVPVGEVCEARINDDPNNALDVGTYSPYTCNYYAVSSDISRLSLN